jgi:NAD(P)-dependent dehydrogenase (short-subunit alcohol dehydrogenase family)
MPKQIDGEKWTAANIPSQAGKLAIVTGANSGIGFQAAKELARAGATVILACRNPEKADAAKNKILAEIPNAKIEIGLLDVSSLKSVREFAKKFIASDRSIDILINNAGIMAFLDRKTSVDGFEMQFATNHLGHFALTGLLLPTLLSTTGSRVISVASLAHQTGTMYFNDLQFQKKYKPWAAYAQSKLSNILFALELDRRLKILSANVESLVCHPGLSDTELGPNGPGSKNGFLSALTKVISPLICQSEKQGALPTLRAATDPGAKGGEYYGPSGFLEWRGSPVQVKCTSEASDPEVAAKLWKMSEELCGVRYL